MSILFASAEFLKRSAKPLIVAALPALLLSVGACAPAHKGFEAYRGTGNAPGTVISVERLQADSALKLRAMLWLAKLPEKIPVEGGITLYRLRYWTQLNGQPVDASGLVALPNALKKGQAPRGTVMYLHGTAPAREDSPSAPATSEGVLPAAAFAGNGYLLVAPDYIGLGQSRGPQSYLYNPATVAAARDLLTAAHSTTAAAQLGWTPNLYLIGFSQGGNAVAVVQRALEQAPMPVAQVRGAAAIAGAFDLTAISVPYALQHNHSLYLAFLAHSYAIHYRQPPATILAPQWASAVPKLFNGDTPVDKIAEQLPKDASSLFTASALASLKGGPATWFSDALAENQAYQWVPKAPLRLYFGAKDTDVSPRDSLAFADWVKSHGGKVETIDVGPYTHGESVLHAFPKARAWFDTLSR